MTPLEQFNELKQSQDLFVRADKIAPLFEIEGKHPKTETLIFQAKNPNGKPLPFKFVILGTHVYFNRLSFIEYIEGRNKK